MVVRLEVKHVIPRRDQLFFRIVIPKDLREHFNGKREHQQTLKTKDHLEAKQRAEPLHKEWKAKFEALRAQNSTSVPAPVPSGFNLEALAGQFERNAQESTQKTLGVILELPLSGLKLCKEHVFEETLSQLDRLLFSTDLVETDLKAVTFHPLSHIGKRTLYAVCEELLNGIKTTDGQLRRLARRIIKTLIKEGNVILSALHKEEGLPDPVKEHHKSIIEGAAAQVPLRAPETPSAPLLSAVLDECLRAKASRRDAKGAGRIKADTVMLIEWLGDKPVDAYSKSDLINFRDDCLLKLPSNRSKKKNYKELSLKQVVKLKVPASDLLSACAVNNTLTSLGTVLHHAIDSGYARINPVLGLRVEKDTGGERSFSVEQVHTIMSRLEYDPEKPSRYWAVIIGLYQGMRLNEICQLHLSDIYTDNDGIAVIDINENGKATTKKHLKNKASRRTIPIHPTVLSLGFMDFVEARRKATRNTEALLFLDVSWTADNLYRGRVSIWFNTVFKKSFLAAKDHKLNFHSLRHTFIKQAQNQARMSDRVSQELTGHEVKGTSSVHQGYSGRLKPVHLLEELSKLDYGLVH